MTNVLGYHDCSSVQNRTDGFSLTCRRRDAITGEGHHVQITLKVWMIDQALLSTNTRWKTEQIRGSRTSRDFRLRKYSSIDGLSSTCPFL